VYIICIIDICKEKLIFFTSTTTEIKMKTKKELQLKIRLILKRIEKCEEEELFATAESWWPVIFELEELLEEAPEEAE
tara:strand:- start:13175 stop:13408 length:234 start_codon:yes stop_codon:yes gene_type:complete